MLAAPAGTVLSNTAELRFDMDGVERTVSSNTVRITLAERLDVAIAVDAATTPIVAADEQTVLFHVSNEGNGAETFDLVGSVTGQASVLSLVADTDGNGVYDPQVDRKLADARLALGRGEAAGIFVIVASGEAGTVVTLTASAATGTGAPGTVFAGKGDGGGDAVVGQRGATASAQITLTSGSAAPSLTKSQTVAAPDGSTRAVKGAIVTYTLAARFPGATRGVEIEDPIPAGAAYIPGSLTLDGISLSDAADLDSGGYDGRVIAVTLGDITAAATRTIRFQVAIQ